MKTIRPPAVAGRFYPAAENELRALVCHLLEMASQRLTNTVEGLGRIKAIIAPHAGYSYSGPIAATAYAWLRQAVEPYFERVVLVGPAHYHSIQGVALPSVSAFATPLGNIPVDTEAITDLCSMSFVDVVDEVHTLDYAIEAHLPFLQTTLETPFVMVPLLVGNVRSEELSDVLGYLWGGPETLIVISSDLSHFCKYEQARGLDAFVSDAIEKLAPEDIDVVHACGRVPIQGLLLQARYRGLTSMTVDLRNSGDTAGKRDKVVGYGAYVFSEPTIDFSFDESQRRELTEKARWSLAHGVKYGFAPKPGLYNLSGIFEQKRATFVTLRIGQELRGCMGSSIPVRALVDDVV